MIVEASDDDQPLAPRYQSHARSARNPAVGYSQVYHDPVPTVDAANGKVLVVPEHSTERLSQDGPVSWIHDAVW